MEHSEPTSARRPWSRIVALARFAPSPHNTQPWRLHLTGEFDADLLRTQPPPPPYRSRRSFHDHHPRHLRRSLRYRSSSPRLHDRMRIRRRPLRIRSQRPAAVRTAGGPSSRAARWWRPCQPAGAPPPGPPHLTAAVQRLPCRTRLSCPTRSRGDRRRPHRRLQQRTETVRWVSRLNRDTLFYDLRDDAIRAEINQWVRTSGAEARRKRDGFSPACLGFPGLILGAFFRRQYLFDQPVIRPLIEAAYGLQSRGTRTVGWFTGPQATPHDWFATGRMFLRLWLTAADEGLSLHPFGSVITNPTAHARLVEHVALSDGAEPIWLLFRIGYSKQPARSRRLATRTILPDLEISSPAGGHPA